MYVTCAQNYILYATVCCSTDVAVRVITVLFLGAYNRTWSAKQY